MKVIRTTPLISADPFYTMGEQILVVDLMLGNGGLKSEEAGITFQTFVEDPALMIQLSSLNGVYTVSLIAETPLEMLALTWHRLIEFIDDNTVKVVFTSYSNLCNVTEEERCRIKARELDNAVKQYTANSLTEST